MVIRKLLPEEKDVYNAAVNHPLQTWEWGNFRESLGIKVERAGLFDKNKLISAWEVYFHKVPRTNFTIGYFPKGPNPREDLIASLRDLARENNALFVKIEPDFVVRRWENHKGEITNEVVESDKYDYNSLGLSLSPKQLFDQHTFILDISKDEPSLLEGMSPKARYNIRLAQRKGIVVEHDNSPSSLTIFLKLLFNDTVKRQGFYMHDQEYFRKMWQVLEPSGIAHILLAKYKEKVLAGWMLFVWNETLYYPYGASSSQMRNLMASNLICWEAIRFGKSMGCKTFDMWGCLPPDANPRHPWYGFHRFKIGYGGELVEFAGSWDLVINEPLYRVYNVAEKIRWKVLRLKKKGSSLLDKLLPKKES